MRALLGLILLVGIFALAAFWQDRWTRGLARARDHQIAHAAPSSGLETGWSRLVLGRPSGADPVVLPDPPTHERAPEGALRQGETQVSPGVGLDSAGPDGQRREYAPDMVYRVRKDDYLGKICKRYYGTARPTVVDGVAEYNELASSDAIREGQMLLLPDLARLLPEEREP